MVDGSIGVKDAEKDALRLSLDVALNITWSLFPKVLSTKSMGNAE